MAGIAVVHMCGDASQQVPGVISPVLVGEAGSECQRELDFRYCGSVGWAIVDRLADIAAVLREANPQDKAEVFRQLGLKLIYHPGRKIVEARVEPVKFGFFDGVRGPTAPKTHAC